MVLLREIEALLRKELVLEWRQKYAVNGILLYTVSTIFVCYLSFNIKNTGIQQFTWNALLWIVMLFTATSAMAKSFIQESEGSVLYYYTLVSPQAIILAKTIYNCLLMIFLSLLAICAFSLVLGNPVEDIGLFMVSLLLGSIGLSISLTMVSAIASKAGNNGILMAILSFPVMIPMLLMLIKVSKNAIDGIARSESYDEILTLLSIDMIAGVLAFILFPYLWRT